MGIPVTLNQVALELAIGSPSGNPATGAFVVPIRFLDPDTGRAVAERSYTFAADGSVKGDKGETLPAQQQALVDAVAVIAAELYGYINANKAQFTIV